MKLVIFPIGLVISVVISSCTIPFWNKQWVEFPTAAVSQEFRETSQAMLSAGVEARKDFVTNIGPNKFGITSQDIVFRNNPAGEGYIAYVEETIFSGTTHYFIWVVVDEIAFNASSHSSLITPHLPQPSEAPPNTWEKTNLSPHSAIELIEFIFEGNELSPYIAPP